MMRNHLLRTLALAAVATALPGLAAGQTLLPAPNLHFVGHEHYATAGGNFVRYRFTVPNHDAFPAAMFAAAPTLPPCGSNTNSSRTWIDFYDEAGNRLYGFCALEAPDNLDRLWFAVPEGTAPPARVLIEMRDRQTNTTYRSPLEAVDPCLEDA